MAASAAGLIQSRLFYITDRLSGLRFPVDTGADVSVVPPSRTECNRQHGPRLEAVNNTSIATFGTRFLTLNPGLRRTFRWIFIIADIRKPILGADFLHHFSLFVDIKGHRLLSVQGIATQESSLSPKLQPSSPENKFTALSHEFPSVTQACISNRPVQHNITQITGPPVSARARHLAPERLKVAQCEFERMMQLGIIRPSSSSWASPLRMVPKKTPGDWRPRGKGS